MCQTFVFVLSIWEQRFLTVSKCMVTVTWHLVILKIFFHGVLWFLCATFHAKKWKKDHAKRHDHLLKVWAFAIKQCFDMKNNTITTNVCILIDISMNSFSRLMKDMGIWGLKQRKCKKSKKHLENIWNNILQEDGV